MIIKVQSKQLKKWVDICVKGASLEELIQKMADTNDPELIAEDLSIASSWRIYGTGK